MAVVGVLVQAGVHHDHQVIADGGAYALDGALPDSGSSTTSEEKDGSGVSALLGGWGVSGGLKATVGAATGTSGSAMDCVASCPPAVAPPAARTTAGAPSATRAVSPQTGQATTFTPGAEFQAWPCEQR
jgi:hypothetical protein